MRRSHAVAAEIVGCVDQPGAEVMLPDAVDDHAPRKRVGVAYDPIGQSESAFLLRGLRIDLQRHKLGQGPRPDGVARGLRIAAIKQPGRSRLSERTDVRLGAVLQNLELLFGLLQFRQQLLAALGLRLR